MQGPANKIKKPGSYLITSGCLPAKADFFNSVAFIILKNEYNRMLAAIFFTCIAKQKAYQTQQIMPFAY